MIEPHHDGRRHGRLRHQQRNLPIGLRLVLGLALLVALGTSALMLPGVATRPLALNEALFTATSALSVTGLSIIVPANDLTLIGQLILLLLIQIGGVGFMVFAVIVFRLLGRSISLTDRLALTDSFGLLSPRAIVQLAQRVLITVLLIELSGALILWFLWEPHLGEQALLYAIFHAVSAFCNAGFDLFNGLPHYPRGVPNDTPTLAVLGTLIFLGGLGIPVLAEIGTYYSDRRFSLHTRLTLGVVLVLVVLGMIGIFIGEGQPGMLLADESAQRRLVLALFQSISARTAGFAGFAQFEELSPASQILLCALMFIGCAPASMGGGITTGTFVVLTLALWSYARRLPTVRVAGRSIAVGTVRKAAAVLTISLIVVTLATWLILITHPTATLNQALFEVISAFATCGLSLGLTSELNLFGQAVVMVMMFWGRLGALTLVAALAQPQAIQRVNYPEEQVLIG
ncbi:MAG TPA: potassium transporter TrkG [Roseiflexaceae bacterium]|mgnify:FL=1|nr:potassium transporter TrkG [Roseiflexaceae bacterium]